jgi:pimeloyl-ACP methyl ester carboxylesterase
MLKVAVNGAELAVTIYGQAQVGTPIVLIHGSTVTGEADWAQVAPWLAERWRVIVPDLRGHGASTNPTRTYSFSQQAQDLAELIRALGHTCAHVIGHSNGGNTALAMAVEQPEVVACCVAQAANAYVSQDLIDNEPPLFDPERVARERPEWRNEMIALHGPTHGPDYWRELLQLTVAAIVREPNYTPADLARVRAPLLAVQGEYDTVNAPAGHAQFIARHVPGAELWLAEGIGHNVHLDSPSVWLGRVRTFLNAHENDADRSPALNTALRFVHALHHGQADMAQHALSAELQAQFPANALADSWRQMLAPYLTPPTAIEAINIVPDRDHPTSAWCFISVSGDVYSEGLALTVRDEAIIDVVWGRP